MATPTTSASKPGPSLECPSWTATAVPSSTGDTDAASVAGREAIHQTWDFVGAGRAPPSVTPLGPAGEAREVRFALLDIGVSPLLRLLAHVVEEGGVAGQLLDAGQAVVGRVHARLDHAQCELALLEDLPAPLERLLLQPLEGHDRVDQAHLERLPGVVLVAEEPDLTGLLLAHDPGQEPGAVAAVEAAHPGAGLAEAGVVGGDRQIADDVEDVA